jgi:anti-anti-sigma factor
MSAGDLQHLSLSRVDDVVIVEITTKSIQGPVSAQELGAELRRVAAQDWAKRLVVNFHRVNYLSSTGFAVLARLANEVKAANKELKLCGMDPQVRLGAELVHLELLVPIVQTEDEAIKSFASA